jgi:GH35 family endo-1,4-beta-xylanase
MLDQRLKVYIQTVVSRCKGNLYARFVLNEAIFDNYKEFLKTYNWYKVIGADYVTALEIYADLGLQVQINAYQSIRNAWSEN